MDPFFKWLKTRWPILPSEDRIKIVFENDHLNTGFQMVTVSDVQMSSFQIPTVLGRPRLKYQEIKFLEVELIIEVLYITPS
jgi:hypothetical protein